MVTGVNPQSFPSLILQPLFHVHAVPGAFLFLLEARPPPPALRRGSSTVLPVFFVLSHVILSSNHMFLEPVVDVKAIIRCASCLGDVNSWLCVSSRGQNKQHKNKTTTSVNSRRIHSSSSPVLHGLHILATFCLFLASIVSPPLDCYSIMTLTVHFSLVLSVTLQVCGLEHSRLVVKFLGGRDCLKLISVISTAYHREMFNSVKKKNHRISQLEETFWAMKLRPCLNRVCGILTVGVQLLQPVPGWEPVCPGAAFAFGLLAFTCRFRAALCSGSKQG